MTYKCHAFMNATGKIEKITLFGSVITVKNHTEKDDPKFDGYEYHCTAVDSYGNRYRIFADYDQNEPFRSKKVAFKTRA